jgi:putative transposase
LYYEPRGESELNLKLMRLLDEQYTKTPFFGVPKMTRSLRDQGDVTVINFMNQSAAPDSA